MTVRWHRTGGWGPHLWSVAEGGGQQDNHKVLHYANYYRQLFLLRLHLSIVRQ